MLNLFGFETNLKQLAFEECELGMELFHKLGDDGIKSGFLIACNKPALSLISGEYTCLPYIQYFDENGDMYGVKSNKRPEWFNQYTAVNPRDLYVEAAQ